MVISKSTMLELERIQNMIARFILRLLRSAATAAGYLDGGIKPIDLRIKEKISLFAWKLEKTSDNILARVYTPIKNDVQDAWNKWVIEYLKEIGLTALRGTKRSQQTAILEHAVANVLEMKKRDCSYLSSMPQPRHWFRLPIHVNDTGYNLDKWIQCRFMDII